jgi:hypothetical protein
VAQSSDQAPFTSEVVGSILARVKRVRQDSVESFLPQGKLPGWVRINTVRGVISHAIYTDSDYS